MWRTVGHGNGAVDTSDIHLLGQEGDGDFAWDAIGRDRRNWDSMDSRRLAMFEFWNSNDFLRFEVLPASNDLCGRWLGENKSASTISGQLCEGLLVAMVGLVLRYDDEVNALEIVQGLDAGFNLVP